MKKIILLLVLAAIVLFMACEASDPTQPNLNVTVQQLLLRKMVAVGNSLTAGFQSAGLVEDFQLHSYPYLIAKQMGQGDNFQQPLISTPGIGSTPGKTPMKFVNGQIVVEDLTENPMNLLKNLELERPYDNLGVPGADANDVLNTVDASGGNPFFNIVLRNWSPNPNDTTFGNMTQLEQALFLNPSLILLWIGNNDVLGAALSGGDPNQITSQSDFQSRMTQILTTITQKSRARVVMANIPYVTDIPFVNTLDGIFHDSPALGITTPVPVVFDATLQPVLLDSATGLYLPLLTEETGVVNVLLPALSAYSSMGLGVPDSSYIADMFIGLGVDPFIASLKAQAIVQGLMAKNLIPSGIPIPGTLTLTAAEISTIKDAVDGFNQTLTTLAGQFQVPLVDANAMLTTLNTQGLDGYSGKYVLLDPANTAFSLDGVHPNNGGYAIVANLFIQTMNAAFGFQIPTIDVSQFKGQYTAQGITESTRISTEAVSRVKDIFVK